MFFKFCFQLIQASVYGFILSKFQFYFLGIIIYKYQATLTIEIYKNILKKVHEGAVFYHKIYLPLVIVLYLTKLWLS